MNDTTKAGCAVGERFFDDRLRTVVVRPIRPDEGQRWAELMAEHHYLGFRLLVGNSLKYVAEAHGEWLALMGWGGSAFKSGPRDRWIGWTRGQQWQRLHLVVNNLRFLVLPEVHIPNLASRVLSLNLKRLSADWESVYGHPVLLVETFVDLARFRGTCYRAAGWQVLGNTRGFGRNAGRYFEHGKPKMVLVRPLQRQTCQLLSSVMLPPELANKERSLVDLNSVSLEGAGGLVQQLARLKDPRKRKGIRHQQLSILAVAVCAVLSGARSFVAIGEWASQQSQELLRRLKCRKIPGQTTRIPPSESTLRRTLQSVDAEEADRLLGAWLSEQNPTTGGAVAIDGKTLRGSGTSDGKPVHLLAALLHKEGIVIGQRSVDEKTNEIPEAPKLLKDLDLEGRVLTADALHTQVKLANFLKQKKKADYVFIVKENQPKLLRDIQELEERDFSPSARRGR